MGYVLIVCCPSTYRADINHTMLVRVVCLCALTSSLFNQRYSQSKVNHKLTSLKLCKTNIEYDYDNYIYWYSKVFLNPPFTNS